MVRPAEAVAKVDALVAVINPDTGAQGAVVQP